MIGAVRGREAGARDPAAYAPTTPASYHPHQHENACENNASFGHDRLLLEYKCRPLQDGMLMKEAMSPQGSLGDFIHVTLFTKGSQSIVFVQDI